MVLVYHSCAIIIIIIHVTIDAICICLPLSVVAVTVFIRTTRMYHQHFGYASLILLLLEFPLNNAVKLHSKLDSTPYYHLAII